MDIPSAYRAGYEKARSLDPELARTYIQHTVIDDPPADAAIAALASMEQADAGRFIQAGMESDQQVLAEAPREFRDFFDGIEAAPPWFDSKSVLAGCRAFNLHSDAFIQAFTVVTLRNAATPISKAFHATGRVLSEQADRRIRQNTRHLIEIMLPYALERHGDGWKLSVRIRLVHAQVRRLIRRDGEWDESVYGAPISAAHMGLSSANFSATLIREAMRLGAKLDGEMRHGIMQIWRYTSLLAGTPEVLLFEGDEAATARFSEVGRLCEPPPGEEAIAIANHLVQALPGLAGKGTPLARRAMEKRVYRVSRALLGHEIADQLHFPRLLTAGLLPVLRCLRASIRAIDAVSPGLAGKLRRDHFLFLLHVSTLLDMSYLLPDKLKAHETKPW